MLKTRYFSYIITLALIQTMIITKKIQYRDSDITYEGILAYNQNANKKLPITMIAHAFGGQSKFEENKAIEPSSTKSPDFDAP